MKIQLTESSAWTGDLFRLTIDAGEARFWGSDVYKGRFPDLMPLKDETVDQLEGAIGLLGVFNWRKTYRSEDVGAIVDDGGSWALEVSSNGQTIKSSGYNACPGYRSAEETVLTEERYGLLREAIFTALNYSVPFGFSLDRQQAEQGGGGQAATSSEST